MRFVDTNILLYSISTDPAERNKADIACAILDEPDLALSVQVLQEFYVQATRAGRTGAFSGADAWALMETWLRFRVQDTTAHLVRAAVLAARRWQISYWDAAIVEAARAQECRQLLSEDLQHGQDFGGVVVVNPFVA